MYHYISLMKFKFPSAQTILFIIAALVALMTWLVPAGKYDSLTYNSDSEVFEKTSLDITTSLNASQTTLDSLDIAIPLEKFTSGKIYKAIAIPNSYKKVDSNPQGFAAFLKSPNVSVFVSLLFLVSLRYLFKTTSSTWVSNCFTNSTSSLALYPIEGKI